MSSAFDYYRVSNDDTCCSSICSKVVLIANICFGSALSVHFVLSGFTNKIELSRSKFHEKLRSLLLTRFSDDVYREQFVKFCDVLSATSGTGQLTVHGTILHRT